MRSRLHISLVGILQPHTVRQGYLRPSGPDAFALDDSEQIARRDGRVFQYLGKHVPLEDRRQLCRSCPKIAMPGAAVCLGHEPLPVHQMAVPEKSTCLRVMDVQHWRTRWKRAKEGLLWCKCRKRCRFK